MHWVLILIMLYSNGGTSMQAVTGFSSEQTCIQAGMQTGFKDNKGWYETHKDFKCVEVK